MNGIDPEVRAILVCPRCRGELVDVPGGLRCPAEALVYPVRDGIPWLVSEEARPDHVEGRQDSEG